ncbi:unnamed protein product (macronuclear) [Paramecium tetraurelia]|uniref:Autophagy protein 5 n=1 Tax=Paramecium tetraurelia TaxID=5888 RepID=A0D3W3_PARTE|nr:uncharacterized protein GSPATT00013195001 [Paramecium tetraurelia]CAK77730.1 unnamed protein product [Paramecium tetraurelia]|eukprot:XP_001445127.1 hypothetical protein (macronuclear) [Paramecium tetraurelia strain d4-2]
MNSQQYQQEIWDMRVAVRVELQDSKIPPMYLMIYRQHYLLFYYQQIFDHFHSFTPQVNKINQITFQCNEVQLPYQIPFGVLVDLHPSEDIFMPIELKLIYTKETHFVDLEDEIKNQIKFNLKQACFGRYNHEGYGTPLKNLTQYMSISDEKQALKQIKSFENKEDLYRYYKKIFESPKTGRIQLPIRIYFKTGGHLQTIIELKDQQLTIGQALSTKLQGATFIFNGAHLNMSIPAQDFYDQLYSIDGFCYFVCE